MKKQKWKEWAKKNLRKLNKEEIERLKNHDDFEIIRLDEDLTDGKEIYSTCECGLCKDCLNNDPKYLSYLILPEKK